MSPTASTAMPLLAKLVHRWFPWFFVLLAVAFATHVASLKWGGSVLDGSAFRQSQTALSTYSIVHGGFKIAYETPVLGPPWSIPFEFPTYHFCVAALVKLTGMPLDPAGRAVSLAFAAGALAMLFLFVRRATGSVAAGAFAAGLGLITPLYVFYNRTFLIESTALFFALALIVATQSFLAAPRWKILPVLLVVGLLAGLTKATTYAVALAVIAVLALAAVRDFWPRLRALPRVGFFAAATLAAYAIPFAAAEAWVRYTDVLKERNELARFLTSTALHDWNWGTWQQRTSAETWRAMLRFINDRLVGLPLAWVVVFGVVVWALVAARRATTGRLSAGFVLACIAGFVAGPLAFTNLYFRHDYYFLATGIYLPALVGAGLGVLWDHGRWLTRSLAALLALPLLVAALVYGYQKAFYPMQMNPQQDLVDLGKKIDEITPPDGVILIEGRDWDSSLAYYAHRRALMNRPMLSPADPVMQRSLRQLEHPLAAMIIAPQLKRDRFYLPRQVHALHTPMERVFESPAGDVYLPPLSDGRLRLEEAWRHSGFETLPYLAMAYTINETPFFGRPAMLVHSPGLVLLERPADRRVLHVGYGVREDAYTDGHKTDGMVFIVEFEDAAEKRTRLMSVVLDPLNRPDDRGPKSADIALPPGQPGWIHLITESGPSEAFDWSLWRDVRFE